MSPYTAHSKAADQSAIENARGAVAAAAGAQATACGGEAPHQFSASYEARKRALVADVARQTTGARAKSAAPRGRFTRVSPAVKTSWKIAAAVAAVCVALPMGAYAAANHAELFSAMFGDAARQSTPEQPYSFDKGDGQEHTVMVPSREYVPVDPEAAEALVGAATATDLGTIKAGNAELTVTSAVRSEHQMVVAFTLKQDPANPVLDWDAHTNATKGALFADDAPLRWEYRTTAQAPAGSDKVLATEEALSEHPSSEGGELAVASISTEGEGKPEGGAQAEGITGIPIGSSLYVDPERSTADILYCYDYLVFPDGIAEDESISLAAEWSGGRDSISLVSPAIVPARTLATETSAQMALSPLGVTFDMLDLVEGDNPSSAKDPWLVAAVVVNFSDGTEYEVWDSEENKENSMYALGAGTKLGIAFNRLVDPSQVDSVEITTRDGEVVTYR